MSKLPLLAKDLNGKWCVFPYHLLEEIYGHKYIVMYPGDYGTRNLEKVVALTRFGRYFEQVYIFPMSQEYFRLKDE